MFLNISLFPISPMSSIPGVENVISIDVITFRVDITLVHSVGVIINHRWLLEQDPTIYLICYSRFKLLPNKRISYKHQGEQGDFLQHYLKHY